jgi:apolipoprotein N-acyltransferase
MAGAQADKAPEARQASGLACAPARPGRRLSGFWQRPRLHPLFAFLLGAASVAAFAPASWAWLLPLAFALLFGLLRRAQSAKAAAFLGFSYGLGFFLFGVSWVYVSLAHFAGLSPPLAGIATFLFCAYLALFPALAAGLFRRLLPQSQWLQPLLFAALATLAEGLRGTLFTGFPWLAAGYAGSPWLSGFAPLIGVYGLSFLAALSGAALFSAARQKSKAALAFLAAVLLGNLALSPVHWTKPAGRPVKAALLQGNVPQQLKWDPAYFARTLADYRALFLLHPAKLAILPESAYPTLLEDMPRMYLEELGAVARARRSDLLFGIPLGTPERYKNSAVSLGISPSQHYDKVHLVPFGEFPPPLFATFMRLLDIPMSSFSPGAPGQAPLSLAGQRLLVGICYEDLFARDWLARVPDSTMLVNIANTAWFGRSLAQAQHLQISQMRARETGRTMLVAANTGMTAEIGPQGQVKAQLPPFAAGALTVEAQGYTGVTPYVRLGDWPVWALCLAILAACLPWRRPRA